MENIRSERRKWNKKKLREEKTNRKQQQQLFVNCIPILSINFNSQRFSFNVTLKWH